MHPPTILIIQSLSSSSIYHDTWHLPCSNYVLGNLFEQSLSMSSLVYLIVWSPPPHIPYISSPSHYLLFATHAHTIDTDKALKAVKNIQNARILSVLCGFDFFESLVCRNAMDGLQVGNAAKE